MAKVTRIDWTIQTGHEWWSGTDTTVKIEICRDNTLIKRLNLEPGHTSRLDRNELATYYWIFESPDHVGVSISGTTIPYYVDFPHGVSGHLRVNLVAKGDDAWEKLSLDSTVHSGDLRGVPGAIDSVEWVETQESFYFGRDVVLSTDNSEGYTTLTLIY